MIIDFMLRNQNKTQKDQRPGSESYIVSSTVGIWMWMNCKVCLSKQSSEIGL